MTDLSHLSRRERQIMDLVFAKAPVSVGALCEALEGRPTPMAVRRMLAILMDKGELTREKVGRGFLYSPARSRAGTGLTAFRQALATYFDGSVCDALALHLERPGATLSDEEVRRLSDLIDALQTARDDG